MDASLHEIIKRSKDNSPTNKVRSGDVSHVIFVPQQQFLTIRRDLIGDFWEDYCKLVYKGNGDYSIAEINQKDMPVVTVMTFQFNKDTIGDHEIFNDKFLLEIIYAWQQGIKSRLYISDSETELICVTLESDKGWDEGPYTYYQVRLQFPFCKTECNAISKIRESAIATLRQRNTMKHLSVAPEGEWDKIIDIRAHMEPLLMYKSVRSLIKPKMVITNVYGEITLDHIAKETAPIYDFGEAFDPMHHSYVSQNLIPPDIFEEQTDPYFWLPLILSINYTSSITLPKTEDERNHYSSNDIVVGFDDDADEFTKARYFVQYIKDDRAANEFYWHDIGCAFYNSSGGSEEGLAEWIDFTNRSDVFTEEECRAEYPKLEMIKHITYKTLAWYAKVDSPENYSSWHDNWCNEALERALNLQHNSVGEYIYRLYWLEIACSNADKSIWYVFDGTRWVCKQKAIAIVDRINKRVIPNLEKFRIELASHVHTIPNPVEKQPIEAKIKGICSLIEKLRDQGYVGQIIRATSVYYHSDFEDFNSYRDINPNLMGHTDCVTEATSTGITIREGKPEDYITMTTQIRLKRGGYNWNHPIVKDVMEWLKKIHVDKELRDEFLKECASWLQGRNINKRIPIWTGKKDNSKSMIIQALELAFGQYMGKFPTSIFTGRRTQSSGATPEVARTKGKHAMVIQETDEDTDKFRKGIMKEFSGNDSMFARSLHDNGGEFHPMFKLVIVCNRIPMFIGTDDAIKERVTIIPFLSTWVKEEELPATLEEQLKERKFKKDPTFESKIPQLSPALLWILTQYYPRYIKEGIKSPKIVKEHTKRYWDEQDHYKLYLEECIELAYTEEDDPDPEVTVSHRELFKHFKGWLLDSYPDAKLPTSKDAKDNFKKNDLEFDKRWIGVKIIREDDGMYDI